MKVIATVTCKCVKHDVVFRDDETGYVRENFSHCEKCGQIYKTRILRKE